MKKIRFLAIWFFIAPFIWNGADAFSAPIEEVMGKDGLQAYLIEDHQNPLISIAIGFKAGWAYDPPGKEGLSTFVEAMMNEGAGELSSQEFQKALADNGIEFSIESGADDFTIRMTFLTEEKNRAAELLHLALTKPRFDEDATMRIRQQLLASLSQQRNDPDKLATDALQRLAFASHPYSRGGVYSENSIKNISPDDLHKFVESHFDRSTAKISVVGDVSKDGLKEFMNKVFSPLPSLGTRNELKDMTIATSGGIGVIERDIPQSVIAFSGPGIAQNDPDFYPAYLLNYILGGGGFSSRLMQEIRVKRGLSYGIDTDLVNRDHASFLFGSVQTKRSSTKETLDLIKMVFENLRDHGPTQAELERAKTYVIGYYPRNFATIESSAALLLGLQLDDLGINYPETRRALYEKVTLEDVKRVARRLLDPQSLTFVIVGIPNVKADISVPPPLR